MSLRIAWYHGKRVRRGFVVAAALAAVSLLGAIGSAGWGWAVAAWFGASTATFAVCTVRAGGAARDGERSERRPVEDADSQPSSGIERRAGVPEVGPR
jgi:hypothetical protein